MKTSALFIGLSTGLLGLALGSQIGWSAGNMQGRAEATEAAAQLAAAAAAEAPPEGSTLVLSDETREKCDAEGGCRLISLKTAHDLVMQEAKKRAGNCMGVATWKD